jgi:hypothetical protein
LACNPTISNQLVTSRGQAMRYIAENHVFHRDQIKGKLAIASSPFTSPPISGHRHIAMLYWLDYQLQEPLLGLPECRDNHACRNSAIIPKIAERYVKRHMSIVHRTSIERESSCNWAPVCFTLGRSTLGYLTCTR